ncbi:MAG: tetratricopeptide repeat protein [Acidobacteria bacterium]|nr:MAG: tetratricopeptide repeat protein [Acidobacteriota bacterium]
MPLARTSLRIERNCITPHTKKFTGYPGRILRTLTRGGNRIISSLPPVIQSAELRPDRWSYSYVLAVALQETGQVRNALEILRKAHERHPGNLELLLGLATLYRDSGEIDEAIQYASKLIEFVPENPMFRQLLSQLEAA